MSEERKTLEQRRQMTDLERLRHSASHVLAKAILKIWAAETVRPPKSVIQGLRSRAKPHNPAFAWRHEGRAVSYIHGAIRTNGHAAGERERPAGQERVSTRTCK